MSLLVRISFILFTLSLLTYACTPRTAVSERPPAADIPVVAYADINSILERSCSPCHYPDLKGRVTPLDNYKAVKNHLAEMIKRVELPQDQEGFMPYELKKEALSKEEILMLKNWAWGGYRK